ncbi:hypothetical protein RhiirA4_540792 [Rhizophagus irregularis]|uniref:Uncharacterized protein n=1 Tax=Rhizophagus irregularis TaxID=588596 RepID=A0A2I1G8N4_9GLOM|nr:hypothetical protein RhiirA4_540792 [Rhizophagus irregularis]
MERVLPNDSVLFVEYVTLGLIDNDESVSDDDDGDDEVWERIPTGVWPYLPALDVWRQSPRNLIQFNLILFSLKYKHWSIISILEYTKSKCRLYSDSINDLKSDIYASLRCYKEDDNHVNHVYVNSKLDKVITDFEKLFSTAEVKEFVDKLREEQEERGFDTACKINATSASAVKALEISLEKDVFKSAIITPLSPNHQFRKEYIVDRIGSLFKAIQSFYKEYMFDWIEVQADCIKDVMLLFPEFDLTLNKVDGIGVKVASNKEIVFIEVSGGPEKAVLKHVKEDTEKLIYLDLCLYSETT